MKNILIGLIGIIFIGFIFYLSSLKLKNKQIEQDLIELEQEQKMLEQVNDYKPNYENYKFNENDK